jgi:ABC-type sugar transport system ATPase subunit
MAAVELERVTVRFGPSERLRDVSLAIPDGAVLGVIGSSGSGKTTLLRTLAGLEQVAHGSISIGGRDVTTIPPNERNVSMVFQAAALMGHLTVRRNVSFPLDIRRNDAVDTRRRVDAEVRAMHIEALTERSPSTLSVGEQQMVQIARALVRVPSVLLLDEPFAALDESLRRRMRSEIATLQAGYGVTTVMTTNDHEDVWVLPTLLAVLADGALVQCDTPAEVRRRPATLSAAAATGPLDVIEMTVRAETTGFWLVRRDPAGGESLRVRAWSPALAGHVGGAVTVGIRTDDVVVDVNGTVPARVDRFAPWHVNGVRCSVAGVPVIATHPAGDRPSPGDTVRLRIDHFTLFDPATEGAIT